MATAESPTRGESEAHRALKARAVAWAREHGFAIAGLEVSLPKSAYRADVAAATPGQLKPDAATVVFECKAARADFLRDAADEKSSVARVKQLSTRLRALDELIGGHRPDLRRGETLFPEFDRVDLRGTKHATHAALTRELRAAQAALYHGTKFAKLARWRAANFLYLVVDEPGLVRPHEIPAGWGLLVAAGDTLASAQAPVRNEIPLAARIALLERIAATAARTGLRGDPVRDRS